MYKPKKTLPPTDSSGISEPEVQVIPTPTKNKKPKKKKTKVSSEMVPDAHANKPTRPLPLHVMILTSQLRKFKLPKLDEIQRKQCGLSHSGHLDWLLIKKNQCGNGHAGIVCEYSNLI